MERLKAVFEEVEHALKVTTVSGRVPKLLYFLLADGYRTGYAAVALAEVGNKDETIPADAVELLVRKVVEIGMIGGYVSKCGDASVIDRFLVTSAKGYEKSFGQSHHTGDTSLSAPVLPNYKDMDTACGGALYPVYSKLSHLSHPREAQPYFLHEHEIQEAGVSKAELFSGRVSNAFDDLALALEQLLAAWKSHGPARST